MSDYDKIANLEEAIAKKDAEIASLKVRDSSELPCARRLCGQSSVLPA